MNIKILGKGCSKCKKLEENAKAALNELGLTATFEKIKSIQNIVDYGVMKTPGLIIDGKIKSTGKVLSKEEIKKLI